MSSLKLTIFAAVVIIVSMIKINCLTYIEQFYLQIEKFGVSGLKDGEPNNKAAQAKTYFDFTAAYHRIKICTLELEYPGGARYLLTMSPSKEAKLINDAEFKGMSIDTN